MRGSRNAPLCWIAIGHAVDRGALKRPGTAAVSCLISAIGAASAKSRNRSLHSGRGIVENGIVFRPTALRHMAIKRTLTERLSIAVAWSRRKRQSGRFKLVNEPVFTIVMVWV